MIATMGFTEVERPPAEASLLPAPNVLPQFLCQAGP